MIIINHSIQIAKSHYQLMIQSDSRHIFDLEQEMVSSQLHSSYKICFRKQRCVKLLCICIFTYFTESMFWTLVSALPHWRLISEGAKEAVWLRARPRSWAMVRVAPGPTLPLFVYLSICYFNNAEAFLHSQALWAHSSSQTACGVSAFIFSPVVDSFWTALSRPITYTVNTPDKGVIHAVCCTF